MKTVYVQVLPRMTPADVIKRTVQGETVELLPPLGPDMRYVVTDWPPDTRLPLSGDLGILKPDGVK